MTLHTDSTGGGSSDHTQRHDTDSGSPARGGASRGSAAEVLTSIAAVAAVAASGIGLGAASAYDAPAATVEMLRGFDLVTLAVAVPLLVLTQVRPGRWPLLRAGVLAYLVYGYLFAGLTGGLGVGFLLDVTVLCAATYALVLTLLVVNAAAPAPPRWPDARVAAAVLAVLALGLGGMWLAASVGAAVTGEVPAGSVLVESGLAVRLGITLDLWLLVPLYVVAAVMLWRRRGCGRVLGVLAVVAGLLHQLSYVAAMVFQARADVPGAELFDPFEPVIVACYLVALLALVRTGRPLPRRQPVDSRPR